MVRLVSIRRLNTANQLKVRDFALSVVGRLQPPSVHDKAQIHRDEIRISEQADN